MVRRQRSLRLWLCGTHLFLLLLSACGKSETAPAVAPGANAADAANSMSTAEKKPAAPKK